MDDDAREVVEPQRSVGGETCKSPAMGSLRVTVVSDTHLSPRPPKPTPTGTPWSRMSRPTGPTSLCTSDLTLDGTHDVSQLGRARSLLDRLLVPWRAVPGNHDVGANPMIGQAKGSTITADRRQQWLAAMAHGHGGGAMILLLSRRRRDGATQRTCGALPTGGGERDALEPMMDGTRWPRSC
jgi:hypothetical protein